MTKDWSINQVFHGHCYVWAAVLNDIRWLRAVSESKTVHILDRASLGLLTLAAGQCAQKLQSGIVSPLLPCVGLCHPCPRTCHMGACAHKGGGRELGPTCTGPHTLNPEP